MLDLALAIVARTPPWVWAVLVLVLYLGIRGLRPQRSSPGGLLVTPGIFLAVAVAQLASAPALASVLPVWLAGAVPGLVIGTAWASRLPIRIDREAGRIETPGSVFWLVVGLLLFGCRYAIGVHIGLHPELRSDPFWVAAPFAVAGLGTGMAAAWVAVRIHRYRGRT